MSLAIPYPARRRAKSKNQSPGLPTQQPTLTGHGPGGSAGPAPTEQIWHVGLSRPGMFPFREASCPCPKAACGLVVPDPGVPCELHTEQARFLQVHAADDCGFPRSGWRRKRRAHHPH